MYTNKSENEQSSTNAEETKQNKEEYLINRVPVDNSPFYIVNYVDKTLIVLGKYVVHECKTQEEAIKYIETEWWNLIVTTIMVIIDMQKNKETKN